MGKMKPLVIGDFTVERPVIQGGMGVGISLHRLAGAVAKAGGVGIISTAQIGFREPDFETNPLKANLRAIGLELRKAREIAPKGVIGFNIMVATRQYGEYVKAAVKAGADLIISGAGLPVSLPEYVEEARRESGIEKRTLIAPIVSTAKSAGVICKMWDRKYGKAPDLVVIEGPLAGGHLGFSREQLGEYGADTEDVEASFKSEEYDREIGKILDVVRLSDVIIAAQVQGLQLVHGRAPAGEEDDGHIGAPADFHAKQEAVLPRQPQVEQHQMGPEILQLPGHIRKIRHRQHLIPLVLQQQRQLLPGGRVVFYDHDFMHILPFAFLYESISCRPGVFRPICFHMLCLASPRLSLYHSIIGTSTEM